MGDGARRRVAAALALFIGLVVVPCPAARAESVTSEQLRTLSQRAASDPAALRRLLDVDRVDGRPVDVRSALGEAEGEEIEGRLQVLLAGSGGPAAGSARAEGELPPRERAREILEGRKFQPAPTLRPFRAVLRRIGGWLRPVGEPLGRLWGRVADSTVALAAVVVAVIGAAAVVSVVLIRRRSSAGVAGEGGQRPRRAAEDPDALEREADAAERAGELERAFRLRFRAGLVRLDRAGVIAHRPALTTGELARRVPSPRLAVLASTFEEIAYGGRPAQPDDVHAARREWPRVLEEVGHR